MKNILIVDDEEFILKYLEITLLKYFDCKIIKASDGDEALQLCNAMEFDLIITDQRMPKMCGSEFILELKNKEGSNSQIPILFLSAFIMEAKQTIKDIENIFFFEKPVPSEEIVKYVKRTLQIPAKV